MSTHDLLAQIPGNVSARARADLVGIARYSVRHWGPDVARASIQRLLARAQALQEGRVLGYSKADLQVNVPVAFVQEPPWVIAFRPDTMQVLRVLHGRRDFPRIFGRRTPTP